MDVVSLFRLKSVHLLPASTVWKKLVLLLLLLPDLSFPFRGHYMQTQNPLLQCFVPGGTLLAGNLEMKRGSEKISLSLSKSKP